MKFFIFLFNCTFCQILTVKSYEDLLDILKDEKNSLVIVDLIDTFFFNIDESFRYKNLSNTKKQLRKKHEKRSNIDKKIYVYDKKIYDFQIFLNKNNLHMLAISSQRFFTEVRFQNMLLDNKNYINNILFYTKKKSISKDIKYLIRQYDKIIIITRCPDNFDLIEESFNKFVVKILYIPE